ncbi:MAG TPA: DUF3147 family protein [Steroidobacteraceae bacterium]|jgi:hypothetical protein
MEFVLRFLVGGVIVSVFATIADVLRPKGFAGLFGAAPSVALATLGLTLMSDGKPYAALEAKSMIAGAAALLLYTLGCVYFMGVRHSRAAPTTFALLGAWVIVAFGLWSIWLR